MKRKFVTAVLVLAMIMSMSAIALADEPTEPEKPNNLGQAGIAYKEGSIIITDPGDPDIPGGNDWSFKTNRNIDFGLHDLAQNVVEQKYASWMEHRFPGTDYVGVNIKNGTLDRLNVTVEISGFSVTQGEGDEAVRIPTLKGFVLNLVTSDFIARFEPGEENLPVTITNPNKKVLGQPDNATANSTNTAAFEKDRDYKGGMLTEGGKATILNIPGNSVNAASWGGVLTVVQNTVTLLGEAQAVMTWNFDRIPPVTTP